MFVLWFATWGMPLPFLFVQAVVTYTLLAALAGKTIAAHHAHAFAFKRVGNIATTSFVVLLWLTFLIGPLLFFYTTLIASMFPDSAPLQGLRPVNLPAFAALIFPFLSRFLLFDKAMWLNGENNTPALVRSWKVLGRGWRGWVNTAVLMALLVLSCLLPGLLFTAVDVGFGLAAKLSPLLRSGPDATWRPLACILAAMVGSLPGSVALTFFYCGLQYTQNGFDPAQWFRPIESRGEGSS